MTELVLFATGVLATLIGQAAAATWERRRYRRESRLAALKDYVTACTSLAVALTGYANTKIVLESSKPLYDELPNAQAAERVLQVWDTAHAAVKQGMAAVAVQAHLVNALFRERVDPLSAASLDSAYAERASAVYPSVTLPTGDEALELLDAYRAASARLAEYCGESARQLAMRIDL